MALLGLPPMSPWQDEGEFWSWEKWAPSYFGQTTNGPRVAIRETHRLFDFFFTLSAMPHNPIAPIVSRHGNCYLKLREFQGARKSRVQPPPCHLFFSGCTVPDNCVSTWQCPSLRLRSRRRTYLHSRGDFGSCYPHQSHPGSTR